MDTVSLMISTLLLIYIVFNATLSTTAQQQQQQPNEVVSIGTIRSNNVRNHHTNLYRSNFVLRRGEVFNISITLRQPYSNNDKIRTEFSLGKVFVYMPLESELNTTRWSTKLDAISTDEKTLYLLINLPPTTAVGAWKLKFTCKLAQTKLLTTYSSPEPFYIIFNPWCPLDQVYLPREDARTEYVLNEVGKIYIGSYQRPIGREWTYGQFDYSVLPTTMYLLERILPKFEDREDVVQVSRAVSALVNANDDGGIVVGNWSGKYGDGAAPWKWTSSVPIYRQYYNSGAQPVKFGQCWVFGGITTTALRTLGIPSRTISNFVSAHDTDQSLTVDKFFSSSGVEIEGVNGDSVWNFHVWSEAWMDRKDLPPGYGGWQAIDATPQERSNGRHQLGPASLEAIKQGKITYAYDVNFVYSEVNADVINWHQDSRYRWGFRKSSVKTGHVGRHMLTKKIGLMNSYDHEDIVDQYKFPEGSKEEQLARENAIRLAGLSPLFYPSV